MDVSDVRDVREVFTYRLINGESITGVLEKTCYYEMGGKEYAPVATEFVTPVAFDEGEPGDDTMIVIDRVQFATVQLFMAHVSGKASQGEFPVKEIAEYQVDLTAVPDEEGTGEIEVVDSPSPESA